MADLATYGSLSLTFPDRADWVLSRVLAARASSHADKVFLSEPPDRAFTYAEVDRLATRIASGLLRRGLVKGDRLLLMLPNCSEYVLAWFGASRAGIVEVPTNPDYFGEFLEHAVSLTEPAGIVIAPALVERFLTLESSLKLRPRFFVAGSGADVADAIRDLEAHGYVAEPFDALLSDHPLDGVGAELLRHELGGILFTSGTTGRSKGVMMSHAQLYFFADQCVNLVRLTDDDMYMTANPLFHGNAQFLTMYPALIAGASVTLYEKFSATNWLSRVRESGATVTNFVGVMMSWVFGQPATPLDSENALRCIFSAPTAAGIVDDFKKRFGVDTFVEVFGQTEISMPIMSPYGVDRPPGAAGLAVSEWFDVRLADTETDDDVEPGQVGELQLRPKEPWTISSGYWGMPEATAEARQNLWFHTGDGLRRDEHGWYYFVDRLKDTLRRRGENISSQEVEGPLLQHPDVVECAVVGAPADEEAGEDEVKVFVVVREGAAVAPSDLVEWAAERMPSFLVPRYVEFIEALPMTPSGKVQKVRLRQRGNTGATWDRLGTSP
jgi:carnitine-CoA ligase